MKSIERVSVKSLRQTGGKDNGYNRTLDAITSKVCELNKKGNVTLTQSTSSGEYSCGRWPKGSATKADVKSRVQALNLIDTSLAGEVLLKGAILRTT